MHKDDESMTPTSRSLHERARRVLAPCLYGGPSARCANPFMPLGAPTFFSRAEGARLWDVDGKEYIDFLCALGPNLLGYNDPRIEAAAARQRALGDTMTGPAPVMVELAERLVETVSHADWVLLAKNGVDVISAALRIARAQTQKRKVLVATDAYHGAHAWCTPETAGVLPEERAHRIEYRYNDLASLEAAVSDARNDVAAIFATAFKHDRLTPQELPRADYARRCREFCDQTGALLVVDDIRAGFRLMRDCTWELVGVRPDLSCWSKAIANGYPLSALLGSKKALDGAAKSFLTGTYWVQAVPMAAALATLDVIRHTNYLEHTVALGRSLRAGLYERAAAHGFALHQTGPVQMPMILFKDDPDFRITMAFASDMMKRGVYMALNHNLFLCAAMTHEDISRTVDIADAVLAEMSRRRTRILPHPGTAPTVSA